MFKIEDFYSQKRGTKVVSFEPREEFETLNCNLLSSTAESAAYCTNCKTPYVRVCPSASTQSDKDKRLCRAFGWTIDASGKYAAATEEKRDRQYPIAAEGYAAFLLSKAEYDEEDKEYYFENTDEALEQSYFEHVLQDVPKARRESKKQRYKVGCIKRKEYFNEALVELVRQKLEKFKAANTTSVKVAETAILPKESASQKVLQKVLKLFSGDKKKYEEFMREIVYITTSCGYKRLLDEINEFGYKKKRPRGYIRSSYDVLAQYPDTFKHLRTYGSYKKG